MDDRLLALKMAAWLETRLRDEESGASLEKVSGYSENRLRQKFYAATGDTPASYLRRRRLTEAAKDLLKGDAIVDVADRYGYSTQENFTTAFKSMFGLNPGELRSMDRRYREFLSRMKEPLSIMELTRLKQPDLSTTLMSSVKGASDYFDLEWTIARLFGYSGTAFMLNIHPELCPSGPYVWNRDLFYLRLRDLGIRKSGVIALRKGDDPALIRGAEDRLRAWLDAGKVAMLEFLEFQLVLGYDDRGLILLRAWGDDCENASEIRQVSFGNWGECFEREGWACFTLLEKDPLQADERSLFRAALDFALRVRTNPADFRREGYEVGDDAWDAWIKGVRAGRGSSHGHWWNATVWAETRAMASAFFTETEALQSRDEAKAICRDLAATYSECARELGASKDRQTPAAEQIQALSRGRELDAQAESLIKRLMVLC